ncbi:DNA translocase FtsK [Lacticaseibacillus jixianensis]|uniref:DNA translocase FtsK n=1 Tax=Lacticaseibacillus jixianensis TaxID=2486012 RepID=A0ABW4B8V6_9LACO|nr:DNA translocase FtsK [Lacticaseibacillus jixianensis]
MPHYDGPVFHRPNQPAPADYPLPPRAHRPKHEKEADAPDRFAVAPMDALKTPASVTNRDHKPVVDYAQVIAALTAAPAQLYIPDDGTSDASWAAADAPTAQLPISEAASGSTEATEAAEETGPVAGGQVNPAHAGEATPPEASAAQQVTEKSGPVEAPALGLSARRSAAPAPAEVDRELAQTAPLTRLKEADGRVPATVSELLRHGVKQAPATGRWSVQAPRFPRPPLTKQPQPAAASRGPIPTRQAVQAEGGPSAAANGAAREAAKKPTSAPTHAAGQADRQGAGTQPAAHSVGTAAYQLPPLSLLKAPVQVDAQAQADWVAAQTKLLNSALANFHVDAAVVANTVGPTVTQFQLKLAPGVKVSKITNLQDDLKLALAARDIRIEAPIPGHNTVGIEIPNLKPRPVMLKEVLAAPVFQQAASPLTVALGVNLFGQPVVANLAKMPHGLIAGATGAGKSVFINSLITSLLYKATPRQVRLLLIDPKAVELAVYDGLPHLVAPVVSDPKSASAALKWVVDEMERRYQKMAAAHARSLAQFNALARQHGHDSLVMPSIVVIIDELADLMLVAASEIQDYIARITAKARAAGIHLIVATQRPSVDVITGTIKNNIPTRIAFMVASQVDSRTIIDHAGAESLLGRGDMLYLGNGASQPVRLQGTFIDPELEQITAFVREQEPPHYLFDPHQLVKKAQAVEAQDDLFPQVLKYVAGVETVSTSALQRQFSIGYNRAAKLIDELAARHYVSAQNGAKPRDVYINQQDLPTPHDAD